MIKSTIVFDSCVKKTALLLETKKEAHPMGLEPKIS
jgi:hypothetical protein